MRQLYYVPIIHDEADLGSLGAALRHQTVNAVGQERWALHQHIMGGFWKQVEASVLSLHISKVRVYQDGLAADGEDGKRIVEEAAQRGSRNYQLLRRLLAQGAELRKTEDPGLLTEEYRHLRARQSQPAGGATDTPSEPAAEREDLVRARDRFMAASIGASLQEGELGVLFVGVQHDPRPYLPPNIQVVQVKDREQMMDYFRELFQGQGAQRLMRLGRHLTSPTSAPA